MIATSSELIGRITDHGTLQLAHKTLIAEQHKCNVHSAILLSVNLLEELLIMTHCN